MTLEKIQALTDQRMACYSRMQEIVRKQEDEKRSLTEEEKANFLKAGEEYSQAKKDIDELKASMDRKHLLENMEQELYAASKGKGPGFIVGDNDKREDGSKMSEEEKYKKQLEGLALFFTRKIRAEHLEKYGLNTDNVMQGGIFNPPPQWSNEIITALRPISVIRSLATVLPPIPVPGGLGRYSMSAAGRPKRVSEKERAPFDESITFGKREMFTHEQEYTIKMSNRLLTVPTMPVLQMVKDEVARAFGEEQEGEFILSDGDKAPLGFGYQSSDGVPASRWKADHGSATVLSVDAMRTLPKYVHQTLRPGGAYIAHTDIIFNLLLKKDTTNQYLWQPSVQAGVPDRFNGYSFYPVDKMPNAIQSGAMVAVFANFKEYIILDSSQLDVSVEPHLYWETKETGFSFTCYNDAQPNRPEAFAISQMS